MKKTMITLLLLTIAIMGSAQEKEGFKRSVFNHLTVYAGPGTEGVSFGVATGLTNFVELSAGMSIMPGFTYEDDYSIFTTNAPLLGTSVDANINFSRTTFDLKASIYPFGGNTTFFLTGGISMGGRNLGKVTAHSDDVADAIKAYSLSEYFVDYEDYYIQFDSQANAHADVRVKSVRPYLGLGFGRLVSKRRVGFRFELGAQFMDKVKFYQGDTELKKHEGSDEAFYEKISVYPVLRLALTGRIF